MAALLLVVEADPLQPDRLADRREVGRARFHGHPLVHVQHLEDAVHRGEGLLEAEVHPGDPPDRVVHPHQRDQEGGEGGQGQVAGLDPEVGVDHERDEDHHADHLHDRRVGGDDAAGLQVGAQHPLGGLPEAVQLESLHAERLHHPAAADGFLQGVAHLGHVLLALPAVALDLFPQKGGEAPHHRPHQHRGHGQDRVDVDDQDDQGDQGQELPHEVGQRAGHRLLDLVHVVDHPADELAGGVLREEAHRLPDDVLEEPVAHALDDALAGVDDGIVGEVEADALDQGEHEKDDGDPDQQSRAPEVEPVVEEGELLGHAGSRRAELSTELKMGSRNIRISPSTAPTTASRTSDTASIGM